MSPVVPAERLDERTRKLVRGSACKELDAAINWRIQKIAALNRGERHVDDATKVAAAGVELLERMASGVERTRSGHTYKPSTIRGCEQALRMYIVPVLGNLRVVDVKRRDVQDIVDALVSDGFKASTVRNALLPLRLICRRALRRGTLLENPMLSLALPAVERGRERIASRDEARRLIDAVAREDARIWATAMYAGLRYGELRALLAEDVDLDARLIHVRAGWDPKVGRQAPKSAAGVRSVPIIGRLRPFLEDTLAERPAGLLFATDPCVPFQSQSIQDRADRRWDEANLNRITLHECRHTFASLMIAAGANAKTLQTYMGHSTITTTLDLYGHLFPGAENEFIALADRYLDAA